MKAVINVEMFGEEDRRNFNRMCSMLDSIDPAHRFGSKPGGALPPSSWVAEITGRDARYTFRRDFLPFKLDYSRANSKGSRGIYREYVIESGHIYEVKAQVSWGSADHYFCMVSDEGDIVRLDEIDVRRAFGIEEGQP